MYKYIQQIKWWLIYFLLNSKERSIFLSNLKECKDGLERYSDYMGETYQEYVEEVQMMFNKVCIFYQNNYESTIFPLRYSRSL